MVFRNIFFSSFLSQITNETYREKKLYIHTKIDGRELKKRCKKKENNKRKYIMFEKNRKKKNI